MLKAAEITKLMWQCAIVYGDRHEARLCDGELKVLRAMRCYFRADERPPQSLVLRALDIVSMYKACQRPTNRRPKIIASRKARAARLETAFAKTALKSRTQATPAE